MLKKFKSYISFLKHRKKEEKEENKKERYVSEDYRIAKKIDSNLCTLKQLLGNSSDMIFREFNIGVEKQRKGLICFIDGLISGEMVSEHIAKILSLNLHITENDESLLSQDIFDLIKKKVLNAVELKEVESFNEILDGILSGNGAVFIDGYRRVLIINVKGWEARGVEEANTEATVRGSREGFNETLRVNTALVRRRIKSPNLVFESFRLGKETHTDVSIGYIRGVVNKNIVEEVKKRLNRIDTDSILESGYIEQFIEDHPFSFFATIGNSEKPDKVAAKLLEGRVAIFCDGTPFVLTVPYLFMETLQSAEDYYSRIYLSSLSRIFRFLSFLITVITPALYVALSTFHQEMIPAVLLITMASAREGVPFPVFVEAMVMGLVFELLRESGVRMPRPIGQAVSIVGGLVIGESAVRAGLVGAPIVVITALTGITSFVVPSLLDSVIFFRLFLIVLAGAFGLYGIGIGAIVMLAHMCSLRSFGVPYLAPLAPTIWKDLRDFLIRAPLWLMKSKPKTVTWKSYKIRYLKLLSKKFKDDNRGEEV
ncbi:spore germination protein [Geosporobacter ferrireducens]|uniref:Spore gernimation protein KA n=1 Tax=Geosporobacter ferrireducens TaxID=1424294 RepID=A0A1D8GFG3_9FIRM|nr:spore germination protein [Geosporobacter ferrireducens]AOT69632.1 spore gernimation protein KA [Geosporobacter ferrireducens]MTI54665.1 spore germination protein [Geosporobacter ferrireducens]